MTSLLTNAVCKGLKLQTCGVLSLLQKTSSPAQSLVFVRYTSFFNKSSKDDVWDSMTSVSNTGKKRGRGRGLMRRHDIYRGKRFNPIKAAERISQRAEGRTPIEPEAVEVQDRKQMGRKGPPKLTPLERGYTGKTINGQNVGVPKNIDGYDFEENGFKSVCIEMKYVARMTKTQKNVIRASALVVLGNGKGLAGFGVGKATQANVAINLAKQKAALRLMYFEPFNGRTLWHNFYEEYHRSKVYAFRKEEGYGIRSHQVIKSICELIGIKDIYAKVEGETKNWRSITCAIFNGLNKQKTHQELADETGENIIEYDSRMDWYPRVVAKPSQGSKATSSLKKNYDFDYETYFFGGKMFHKPDKKPVNANHKNFRMWRFSDYRRRNQPQAKLLRAVYGLEPEPSRSK